MNRFINQTEAAAFAENAARTEVTDDNGITVVYSGTPHQKDPDRADDGRWVIKRTSITDDRTSTRIEVAWAEGSWADRASLTYQYL